VRPAIGLEPSSRKRWQRLRALLRPPRTLRITTVGRTYVVITVGIGIGAVNTGNNLLYLVLGLLLSVIIASGILSERCLRHLQLRRIGADAAFAGEPFAFRWAVSHARGGAFALTFSEANPDLEGEGVLAYLPPGEERVVRGDLLGKHRGPHHLAGVRVTTDFPLGLFAKSRFFPSEGTLLVFPRRVPGRAPGNAARDTRDGTASSPERTGGTGDVASLVPLREGEDARRIHWLKSASLGQLVRLDREREERRTYMLRANAAMPPEALDRHCEALAARARMLLAQGHQVGLEAGGVRLRPAGGTAQERRILAALARLGFDT
jgi:uncharacterized protein (DUF58 family)